MSKIAVIKYCNDCPHFRCEYHDYSEDCTLLDRRIYNAYIIPDDCPLDDYKKCHVELVANSPQEGGYTA